MRRLSLVCLALALWVCQAWADAFTGPLPQKLAGCLSGSVFEQDEVLQGAWLQARTGTTALLAVRRENRTLLVAATHPDAASPAWHVYPVSEKPPAADFSLGTGTFAPTGGENWFSLTTDSGCFYLAVDPWDAFLVGFEGEGLTVDTRQVNTLRLIGRSRTRSLRCLFNPFSELVDFTAFPTDEEAMLAYARTHPLVPATSLRVMGGMNLRAEPTGRSESLAVYRSPVLAVYLTEVDGPAEPWVQVRVGETVGWVTNTYVAQTHDSTGYPLGAGLPVGELTTSAALTALPGGEALKDLEAGTLLHVLTRPREGLVQVCVPQGDIAYEMDPEGLIGWLPEDCMRVALSPLQREYGIWEE